MIWMTKSSIDDGQIQFMFQSPPPSFDPFLDELNFEYPWQDWILLISTFHAVSSIFEHPFSGHIILYHIYIYIYIYKIYIHIYIYVYIYIMAYPEVSHSFTHRRLWLGIKMNMLRSMQLMLPLLHDLRLQSSVDDEDWKATSWWCPPTRLQILVMTYKQPMKTIEKEW